MRHIFDRRKYEFRALGSFFKIVSDFYFMFYTKLFIVRLFLGFVGFRWILLDFDGFCLVLLGCLEFNFPKMLRSKSSKKLDKKENRIFSAVKMDNGFHRTEHIPTLVESLLGDINRIYDTIHL